MSGSSWEWMFVDDADAGEVAEAERELAERRDVPPGRKFAGCDCDEQRPSDEYRCDECYREVWICADCYTIISGCGCGTCAEGQTLEESGG